MMNDDDKNEASLFFFLCGGRETLTFDVVVVREILMRDFF